MESALCKGNDDGLGRSEGSKGVKDREKSRTVIQNKSMARIMVAMDRFVVQKSGSLRHAVCASKVRSRVADATRYVSARTPLQRSQVYEVAKREKVN